MQTIYEETKKYLTSTFKERITKKYNFLTLKEQKTYDDGPYTDQPYEILANNITNLYDIDVHMDRDEEIVSITVSYVPNRFTDDTYYKDEYVVFGASDNDNSNIEQSSDVESVVHDALHRLLHYLNKDIFIQHLYKLSN